MSLGDTPPSKRLASTLLEIFGELLSFSYKMKRSLAVNYTAKIKSMFKSVTYQKATLGVRISEHVVVNE